MPPFNLERFLKAQASCYADVLRELRSGRKTSHWMWFIFPQFRGLGSSPTAQFYAIGSPEEAAAYLRHPVLGPRLVECVEIINALPVNDPEAVFGPVDALKLRSSLTLFELVAEEKTPFQTALDKFYNGVRDERTMELVRQNR